MPADLVIRDLRGAVVGPVALSVAPGTCSAISGPSGAGKTLMLRMIADLEPNEGDVRLGDVVRDRVTAPDWRRRVAYLAGESGWWMPTVAAHFAPDARAKAEVLADRLGLDAAVFDRQLAILSSGERQRLALARALVRRPNVLLLDEPTAALDPASIAKVEAVLQSALADGLAIVLVSHDAAQTARLGTTRYTMTAGRLEAA